MNQKEIERLSAKVEAMSNQFIEFRAIENFKQRSDNRASSTAQS